MKILSIGPAFPLRGGIAKFNESLSIQLGKEGHEVVVFTYRYQYPSFLFPGKSQFIQNGTPPDLDIRSDLHSINLFTWRGTCKRILDENPDLVIVHYWMPFFAPQLNYLLGRLKRKRKKVILLAHNLMPHERQPGTRYLTGKLLSRIDGLLCLSSSVQTDALNIRDSLKTLVIPHPVYDVYGEREEREHAIKALGLQEDYRYLLFFGLIRAYKGLDLLLKAIPEMERKDIKILVAGEFYESRENYRELIDDPSIAERLLIKDSFIPDDDVRHYFCAADLVVQPYRTATQSGVTQIAYHFGIPMIVTRVGGLPEIVVDGSTGYVTGKEPEEIAEAVNRFYREDRLAAFKENVLLRSADFSWKAFCEKLTEFARSL